MSNEMLERIADALEQLTGAGDDCSISVSLSALSDIASELAALGSIAEELHEIRGELWELRKEINERGHDILKVVEKMNFDT